MKNKENLIEVDRSASLIEKDQIIEKLKKMANGYSYEEEEVHVVGGRIEKVLVVKFIPPSIEAMQMLIDLMGE